MENRDYDLCVCVYVYICVVQKRISDRFIVGRQRSRIEYYVKSVFWVPPFEQDEAE